MDKTGLVTLIIGIILLIAGIVGIYFFLPEFISFFLGGFGICLALIGAFAILLGVLMLKE